MEITKERLVEVLGDPAVLEGWVVGWEIPGKEVPYYDVLDALRHAGLRTEVAGELGASAAFNRGCRSLRQNRTIDKVERIGKTINFQFTSKVKDGGKIDFDYEAIVSLDTESGDVTCPENADLAQRARDLLKAAMGVRNQSDITRYCQQIFRSNGDLCPFTSKGGAYFVPAAHGEFVMRVREFVKEIGGKLATFPVPRGTEAGRETVREAVGDRIAVLISELNEAVDKWDASTRDGTMEKAAERWNVVRFKIEAYETYLGSEQARLRANLDTAKASMAAKAREVMRLKAEKEAAKEAEKHAVAA